MKYTFDCRLLATFLLRMAKARVQLHLRVIKGSRPAVGPGKIALLEAIRDTGSISAAARKLGMSYRRAWMLVDDLNRRLSKPVVAAASGGKSGGGATLSPTGRKLITLYRGIERDALRHTSSATRTLLALLSD
jgi:molybdate transport system regulatory protein